MRLVLLLLIMPLAVQAQTPGQCEPGTAEGVLDANEVRATVFNGGNLFFGKATDDGSGYLVPKHTGRSPIFLASFWVGGLVEGQIRVAGSRYTNFEFWPGPLNVGATLPNPTDCSAYDRIFVLSRDDVAHYLRTGEATDDLLDWPTDLGAPVLDGDGVDGNYDLAAGDQPAINGHQIAWWVMNDVGNVHSETESNPLGIEVQVTAMAGRGGSILDRMTFYRYRIVNWNTRAIENAYVSLFTDPDLGDAADDYIASDTTLQMGVVYNGDENDQGGLEGGYGSNPPALGFKLIRGPIGLPNGRDDDEDGSIDEPDERLGMTATNTLFDGNFATTDPGTAIHYYNRMKGLWNDGLPITEGGLGYQTEGPVTRFVFAGDPVADEFWSEECADPDCEFGNAQGDRQLVIHVGPFRLAPGEVEEVVFALPFAQGSSRLESVAKLRLAAEVAQNAWDFGFLTPTRVEVALGPLETPGPVEISRPFPNPFGDELTIRYAVSEAIQVRIALYDVLGRELNRADVMGNAGEAEMVFDTSDLPGGIYIVHVEATGESQSFSVVKMR